MKKYLEKIILFTGILLFGISLLQTGKEVEAGSGDVCLVVLNEMLEKQEVISSENISKITYFAEPGDKFLIPYREDIVTIFISEKTHWTAKEGYWEMKAEEGKTSIIRIMVKGRTEAVTYIIR